MCLHEPPVSVIDHPWGRCRSSKKDFPKLTETLQFNSTLTDCLTLKFGMSINFPEFPKFFHEEQLMNSGHDGPSELPGWTAVALAGMQTKQTHKVSTNLPSLDLPNHWIESSQILGTCEVSLGESIPKIFGPQTTPNNWNHTSRTHKQPPGAPLKNHKSKVIPDV
jgi:hypothetical protein